MRDRQANLIKLIFASNVSIISKSGHIHIAVFNWKYVGPMPTKRVWLYPALWGMDHLLQTCQVLCIWCETRAFEVHFMLSCRWIKISQIWEQLCSLFFCSFYYTYYSIQLKNALLLQMKVIENCYFRVHFLGSQCHKNVLAAEALPWTLLGSLQSPSKIWDSLFAAAKKGAWWMGEGRVGDGGG